MDSFASMSNITSWCFLVSEVMKFDRSMIFLVGYLHVLDRVLLEFATVVLHL